MRVQLPPFQRWSAFLSVITIFEAAETVSKSISCWLPREFLYAVVDAASRSLAEYRCIVDVNNACFSQVQAWKRQVRKSKFSPSFATSEHDVPKYSSQAFCKKGHRCYLGILERSCGICTRHPCNRVAVLPFDKSRFLRRDFAERSPTAHRLARALHNRCDVTQARLVQSSYNEKEGAGGNPPALRRTR